MTGDAFIAATDGIKAEWGSRPRGTFVWLYRNSMSNTLVSSYSADMMTLPALGNKELENFHRTDVITKQEDDARAALAARALIPRPRGPRPTQSICEV